MSLNFKKTLSKKKTIKDINSTLNSQNKENSILNKINLLDYATLKKMHGFQADLELHEYKYSNEALLISELKKIIGESRNKIKLTEILSKDSESKSSSINNNASKILESTNNMDYLKRNNDTIIRCLKQYQNFIKYMKFHNVSIDLLEKICPYLLHKNIPKNTYLFKENQKENYFFGVIKGKIGLRTFDPNIILENKRKYENEDINSEKIYNIRRKKNIVVQKVENENENDENKIKEEINKNNIDEKNYNKYFEINYDNITGINRLMKEGYDIKVLKKGDCYGIYNLLNNQAYDVNAIALENTDIFYLEKEYFDKYLLTPISRIDLERKYLINRLIPAIPMELLSDIKPEVYDTNHIIYTEFDYAFECFYIYKGSVELKKYSSAKSKNEIYEHKNILTTISKIDEGGIAGLEICKGPTSFYDNTLMIIDPKTILYRFNILNLKGKKQLARSNIKKFFSKLYQQQKTFLKKTELKNQEYKKIYEIGQKIEKPKFNYSNFFSSIFKDVNPPNKIKRNKPPQYQFKKINIENDNNLNEKYKIDIFNPYYNKTFNNNKCKTIENQKKNRNKYFSLYNNKKKKKYIISSKQKSRNDEEKEIPMFNSFNVYNSLSNTSKSKNQIHMITISQDSKFVSYNDIKDINYKNNNIKSVIFGQETQKSDNLYFPKLVKNNSTKNRNYILSKLFIHDKNNKVNSVDKCLYDSGDFKMPLVTLYNNNSNNIKKMKNLAHYAKLKRLILGKKLLC